MLKVSENIRPVDVNNEIKAFSNYHIQEYEQRLHDDDEVLTFGGIVGLEVYGAKLGGTSVM